MTIEYVHPVKFTNTGQYGCGPEDEDDVYTIDEWVHLCKQHAFIDYDGQGYLVKDKLASSVSVHPSMVTRGTFDPQDATHVVWYNK